VAGSQSYPSPDAEPNASGSTTVCLAPEQLEGAARGNWIQTSPSWPIVAKGKLRLSYANSAENIEKAMVQIADALANLP
jgi:hypothetical protein